MLMRKIVNNDVSKDSTMVTRILSDGGDRIWEIRDMETAGFLKKEAVHAYIHQEEYILPLRKMLNIYGTKHQYCLKFPACRVQLFVVF